MKVKPRSKKVIREMALGIRNVLKINIFEKIDIIWLLENIVTQAFGIDYQIVEYHELPNEYAVYCPHSNKITIREDVYEAACNGDGRHRLTIAHEIFHALIHKDEVVLARNDEIVPKFCDPEWQAFTFGKELLCPIDGIYAEDTAQSLSSRYGISKEAAGYQLQEKK